MSGGKGEKMKQRKKGILIPGFIIIALALIYFAGTVFFTEYFFDNTKINGKDYSLMHYSKVEKAFNKDIDSYELKVKGKDVKTETITSKDAGMTYKENDCFKELARNQKRLMWPEMFTKSNDLKAEGFAEVDKKTAAKFIEGLECMNDEGKYPSENAVPEYDGDNFVPKKEVYGNITDKEKTTKAIIKAMSGYEDEIDLEKEKCYIMPERFSDDKALKEACDTLNDYCKASITYDMISHTEVVDKDIISEWVSWDDDLNITFDESKIGEYMSEFASKYDTIGSTRYFSTPSGKQTSVSGGPYGWSIDEAAETEELTELIREGAVVTKEPAYASTAATHEANKDWGYTYCDVDLSAQYMWCVVDGSVVLECPIVSGSPGAHATPQGVYSILSMGRGVTLVGDIVPSTGEPEYRTPVAFWMQITGSGIGFHDAVWQSSFGGNRYTYAGSHGCINMSYGTASTLYNYVYVGMPVVMHY